MKIRFVEMSPHMGNDVDNITMVRAINSGGDSTHRSPLRVSSANDSLRRIIFNSASNQGVDPGLVEAIVAVEALPSIPLLCQ